MGAEIQVTRHGEITAKAGECHAPDAEAADPGDPDPLSPCEVHRRKARDLKRPSEGSWILDITARRVRLKLRLLIAAKSGAPAATLRRINGHKAWGGKRKTSLVPARGEKKATQEATGNQILAPRELGDQKMGAAGETIANEGFLRLRGEIDDPVRWKRPRKKQRLREDTQREEERAERILGELACSGLMRDDA